MGGIAKVFLAIAAGIGYYFVTGHFVFTDKVLYEGIAFGLQSAGLVTVAAKSWRKQIAQSSCCIIDPQVSWGYNISVCKIVL